MDQRDVWENIAQDWNKKRVKTVPDTVKFLQNKAGLILDLGCGCGRNFLKIDGTIVGTDFSEKMLNFARNHSLNHGFGAIFLRSDAKILPFKDDSFDSILFASAFHCIKWNFRKKVLDELKRVAKDGSEIYISVWNKDQPRFAGAKKESFVKWTVNDKSYDRYYYLYSKDELEALLRKYFSGVKVSDSLEKSDGKPKNLIATMKVRK